MCVALHGYHPLVTYQWYRDGGIIVGAVHPVHYAAQCGNYHSEVTITHAGERKCGALVVTGVGAFLMSAIQ